MKNNNNLTKLTFFRLILNKLSKQTSNTNKIKIIQIMKTKILIIWINKEMNF